MVHDRSAGSDPAERVTPRAGIDDADVARLVVLEAGARITTMPFAFIARSRPLGRLALSEAAEICAFQAASEVLARTNAGDGIWAPGQRSAASTTGRVWLIDPLDGLPAYLRRKRNDWACQAAVAHDGQLLAGAFALPATRTVYVSDGAMVDRTTGPASSEVGVRLAVPAGRPTKALRRIATALDAALVPSGSTAAGVAAIIDGRADATISNPSGDPRHWAGSVAVARAAGLHVSRSDGTPLNFDMSAASPPTAILACRPSLMEWLVDAVTAACGPRPHLPG